MGFKLLIATGIQEGQAFSFEQPEARIGRTDENDVVLDEPGVSRLHARVFEDRGHFYAEDLGSANGTKVNGHAISEPRQLRDGDSVAVGATVIAFALAKKTLAVAEAGLEAPDRDATEIDQQAFLPVEGPPPRVVVAARAPEPEPPPPEAPGFFVDGPPTTPEMAAAGRSERSPSEIRALETRLVDVHPPAPAAHLPGEDSPVAVDPDAFGHPFLGAVELAKRRNLAGVPRCSPVADAARRRRMASQSAGAQLRYAWEQLSSNAKLFWGSGLATLGLAFVALVVYLVVPEGPAKVALGPEPTTLSRAIQHASFGLGPGVQYPRPDLKAFGFDFNAATRAVALLHYQAQDISADEVNLVLNGARLASVPADTLAAQDRELDQVLPAKFLRRSAKNELVFDNLHNPPQKDGWRVWNLWVEVIPIPELPNDQLLASAQDYFQKGKTYLDQRDVGSDNLFKAWKDFRISWLMLESLDQRPELYGLVRLKLAESARELDLLCGRMMLAAQKSLELKNRVKAKQRLEEISNYFPTTEHRCHNLAVEKLQDAF